MRSTALRFLLAATLLTGAFSHAAVTLRLDDTRHLSLGVGLRVSSSLGLVQAPDGELTPARPDLLLENALVGMNAQLLSPLRLTLNLTLMPSGELRALDAVAMYEPAPWLNVWAGRMLPPVDRATLTGPLFSSTWDLPFVGIRGALPMGRDDGAVVWGDLLPRRIGYRVGAFRGLPGEGGTSGGIQLAGRLTFHVLEPEPGYYHSGTSYGAREVLSFGVGARHQPGNAERTAREVTTLAIDGLFEKRLPGERGVITAEAAVYRHAGGTVDPSFSTALGLYGQVGYLLPQRLGPGQLQALVRYQLLDALGSSRQRTRQDLNLTYVVQGHPLRFSLVGSRDTSATATAWGLRAGAQLIL